MPAKNVKEIKIYLSPDQINAIKQIHTGNMSALIRDLLSKWVEDNGGTWPPITPRGKYPRKPKPDDYLQTIFGCHEWVTKTEAQEKLSLSNDEMYAILRELE
jgi:hypothetical protein